MDSQKIEKNCVIATKITPDNIFFECPYCWTAYKRDGERTQRSKPLIHLHGNETGDKTNRIITRSPHCRNCRNDECFIISITDDTVREKFII